MASAATAQAFQAFDPRTAADILHKSQVAARSQARLQDAPSISENLPGNVTQAEQTLPSENQWSAEQQRYKTAELARSSFNVPTGPAENEASAMDTLAGQEQSLRNESRSLGVSQLGGIRGRLKQAANQAAQQAGEQVKEQAEKVAKEGAKKLTRWAAKIIGHGSNVLDAPGEDGWITFFISYAYDLLRGAITIVVPEEAEPSFLQQYQQTKQSRYESRRDFVKNQLAKTAAKTFIHTIIPPYRPLREPGDFAYFIFEAIMATVAVTILLFIFTAIILTAKGIYDYFPGFGSIVSAVTAHIPQ